MNSHLPEQRDLQQDIRPDDLDRLSPTVIIGAGLIGASIGCALSLAGVRVHLHDKMQSHAMVAAARGAGVVGLPPGEQVKLVVVAVPPQVAAGVVLRALKRFPAAAVTDVASVKAPILRTLQAEGVALDRYLGSHPMSGSAYSGPLTAAPELFADRTWVLCQRADNPEWVVDRVAALARLCGSRTVRMDADQHDRAVAEVSHLPQLMASLTAARLQDVPRSDLALAGPGVRDVTRIASSDPRLWRQIITANQVPVRELLEAVRDDLDQLINSLDDPEAITRVIEKGRQGVRGLPFKHGRPAEDLVSVVVQIPDAPGSLARLFSDIEAVGVNVEDLAIEHDPVREVGYLAIQVAPERVPVLRAAMVEHGWALRS